MHDAFTSCMQVMSRRRAHVAEPQDYVRQACRAILHKLLIKDARVAHRKPAVPSVVLRQGCAAVWVYCGDKEKCLGSYKECWLKHLVRGLPCDGRAGAAEYTNTAMSLHASLQRQR